VDIQAISNSLCRQYLVYGTSSGGATVRTPLRYDDGDNIVVFLSSKDGRVIVDDNGEAALRLMFDGIDVDNNKIHSWLDGVAAVTGVRWDHDEECLYCEAADENDLAEAITKVSEVSAQMQAMTALRCGRAMSDFKDRIIQVLRNIEQETGIEARYDVPVDLDKQLIADAYFLSAKPVSIVVASTRERLMEAELMWSVAQMRNDPMKVIAVVEDAKKIGIKQYSRANYFTDKTVEYNGNSAAFGAMLSKQLSDSH
jgi:hypothetical protein